MAIWSGSQLAIVTIILTLGSALPLSMLLRTNWWLHYWRNRWLGRLGDDVDDASAKFAIRTAGGAILLAMVSMMVALLISFFRYR